MSRPPVNQLPRRTPRRRDGFTWGRAPGLVKVDAGATIYRLFLRDSTGALFTDTRTFDASATRASVASHLRGMRAQIHWVVDQLEFSRLGLVDTTPAPNNRA